MNPELKLVIFEEKKALHKLLELLDEQYNIILENDTKKLENILNELELAGKNLASVEVKRRKIVGDNNFKSIIENCDDEHVSSVYNEIQTLINSLEQQKNTNDILIKQKLFFTNKMINIIKPSKNAGTYNSYGRVGR